MDRIDYLHGASTVALLAALDAEIRALSTTADAARAAVLRLDQERVALGYHPNHLGHLFGGIHASRRMGAAHILPLAGWYRLPYESAIDRLAHDYDQGGDDDDADLLLRLRFACEREQALEAAGLAWLGEVGLLKRGGFDRYWLKRPGLGLGQPARMHGLERQHHDGLRGLFALSLDELHNRFARVVPGQPDPSFGGLLLRAVDEGGTLLAEVGVAAVRREAKARYEADCASFAAHQAATDRRDWRGKPALSAQGHLARRTATARGLAMPAERARGEAADWLDRSGANIRFRGDDQ